MIHTAVAAVRGAERQQEAEGRERERTLSKIEAAKNTGDLSAGIEYVLRSPEGIRTSEETQEQNAVQEEKEAAGFVFYQIPEEYAVYGGYLPEDVQIYTYDLCKQEGVRYALILAMIERESGYHSDRIGDDGESLGYMQVMQKWHEERMEKLGVNDLLDPYQNIRVGVDYIKELIDRYGTIQDALAAYNYGATGARKNLWSDEVYVYEYNKDIMNRMKEIEEVRKENEHEICNEERGHGADYGHPVGAIQR